MKKVIFSIMAVLLATMLGAANATVYTDLFNAEGQPVGGYKNWHTDWRFDISQYGFDANNEVITRATIEFTTRDEYRNKSLWWEREFALAVTEDEYVGFWEVDAGTKGFDLDSFSTLNERGSLEVALYGLFGEFKLDSALLTVYAESVPEPGVVGLLALGLILAGVTGRLRAGAANR